MGELRVRCATRRGLTFYRRTERREIRKAQASELPCDLIEETTTISSRKQLAFHAGDSVIRVEPQQGAELCKRKPNLEAVRTGR